jgi:hypothetical protein
MQGDNIVEIQEIDKKIDELKSQYRISNHPIMFDFRDFCLSWEWTKRSDVFTHHIHKYPAFGRVLKY